VNEGLQENERFVGYLCSCMDGLFISVLAHELSSIDCSSNEEGMKQVHVKAA